MKNPLELTLLEVAALMRDAGAEAPEVEYTRVLVWCREYQAKLKQWQVQATAQVVREKAPVDLSHRKMEQLDQQLLDNAEIVVNI